MRANSEAVHDLLDKYTQEAKEAEAAYLAAFNRYEAEPTTENHEAKKLAAYIHNIWAAQYSGAAAIAETFGIKVRY